MLFFRRNISSYSDSELVRLYKETGESDYFGELYNRYIPLIYGLCLKYLQEEVKAQDAVMQLFEDLLPKLSRYEIREFRTWIYSVAKNYCFQLLRKENLEIATDFDQQFVETYDILHLLDKEETSDDAVRQPSSIAWRNARTAATLYPLFLYGRNVVRRYHGTDRISAESVKSYIQNGKRNLKSCIEKRMAQ